MLEAYLDIETTGLSSTYDGITVIGGLGVLRLHEEVADSPAWL